MMTWKEFKDTVEAGGVTDEHLIEFIDVVEHRDFADVVVVVSTDSLGTRSASIEA